MLFLYPHFIIFISCFRLLGTKYKVWPCFLTHKIGLYMEHGAQLGISLVICLISDDRRWLSDFCEVCDQEKWYCCAALSARPAYKANWAGTQFSAGGGAVLFLVVVKSICVLIVGLLIVCQCSAHTQTFHLFPLLYSHFWSTENTVYDCGIRLLPLQCSPCCLCVAIATYVTRLCCLERPSSRMVTAPHNRNIHGSILAEEDPCFLSASWHTVQ